MKSPLSLLYKYLPWPMKPSEPEAQQRFKVYVNLFESLLREHPAFTELVSRETISILDVAAGTRIGGAAAAKALAKYGLRVKLVAVDIREEDLAYVGKWLEETGIEAEYETAVAPTEKPPETLQCCYDLALILGSSFPHFSPWDAAEVFAGLRELQPRHSILVVEQWDLAGWLIRTNSFKHILVERPIEEDGNSLISVYGDYNMYRGTFRKAYYRLPGWEHVATVEVHL